GNRQWSLLWWHVVFDNRERSALRIVENREAPDSGNIIGGFHHGRAKSSRLLQLGIAVINGEIYEPVWRNRSHFGSDLVHTAGSTIAVIEQRVLHWPKVLRVSGPAQQVRIKLSSAVCIVGAELIPAERIRHVVNCCARGVLSLPDRKNGARRILDDGHPSRGEHVERTIDYGRAFSFGFLYRFVCIHYRYIAQPVRGDALCDHVGH